ncbi:MAG: alpha-hydroxy-acid oxidizing protein [Elusimicrobiota bacterium]|jgi:isopentenyl diphosphate isomerase/L-lactate dehydrogenase-like FMN-dependent dehydrogenase|nr:alpha-hydroxy-acid oxidizing protein [Elusimicrobiota bacterium]
MKELWQRASEKISKAKCKVCPVCNGVACSGLIPGMGGIGSGSSFHNNIKALADKKFIMRVLHEANEPSCEFELWGRKLSLPVMIAPIGDIAANVGGHLSIPEYTGHIIDNCIEAGTLASIGDLPGFAPFESAINQIKGRGKSVIPFIKTWSHDEFLKKLEIAAKAGCDICGTDVDSAGLLGLRNCETPVSVWTSKELTVIIKKVHGFGMKYIVKGIMSAEDAKTAVDCGADAILVSNHGGRVLDYTQGTAEVLPQIVDVVGKNAIVMVDGGIRTGADVLKMLALGAKFTLICRPAAIAVHGDEKEGLKKYFAKIKNEILHTMRMTGVKDLANINKKILL